ncbi:hypothetical protein DE146DRAFT_676307 [Phaeosphaeria sp. MPI-PUGE-AT-0046c]|nr:hypothetical protein DE146DRAFT_676307 [Phaeosphaeria sp. MPI-PUGE-AT-0046c]
MVGVAGRSKGCITCRSRKKGCDLKQPICGQCEERGIHCGGYDNDRIFIRHDSRPKYVSASASPNHPTTIRSASSRQMQNAHLNESAGLVPFSTGNGLPATIMPFVFNRIPGVTSLTQSAFREKSMEALMQTMFAATDMRSMSHAGREVVGILPKLSASDEALRLAVLALGTVALSSETNDTALARQGHGIYGKALVETRRALQNPDRARSTAILAIPPIMALFEILFGAEVNTTHQAQSWLSHAEGEIALFNAHGPEAFIEDIPHSFFVMGRYRPLIAAVRTRKRSVLNEERWKTVPWRGRTKTPEDTLLDIMAAVPESLENVDRFGTLSSDAPEDQAKDLETATKCWDLHNQLQEWLLINEHEIYKPITMEATPIEFANFQSASLTIRYWVLGLLIYSTLDTACRIPNTDTNCTHRGRPHPRYFARLIARSAAYFFREEFGVTGPTRFAFPLGNAMLYMRRDMVLDREYLALVKQTWDDPKIPGAIKKFLNSLRLSVTTPQAPPPEE